MPARTFVGSALGIAMILLCFAQAALALNSTDLATVPLATTSSPGPANILFVIDDSGSMDFEFMTPQDYGTWNGDVDDEANVYIFDNPGDNTYSRNDLNDIGHEMRWKSQWSAYNKMYYDPDVTYDPWPRAKEIANSYSWADNLTTADAVASNARSHPMEDDDTLDLTATFYHFSSGNATIVDNTDTNTSYYERFPDTSSTYWYSSQNDAPDYFYGSDYDEGKLYESDDVRARWTPDLPLSGDYTVYVSWPGETDNNATVNYIVDHATGTYNASGYNHVDSSGDYSASGDWLELGTFQFDSGQNGYVELQGVSHADGTSEFSVDAVKFVKTSGTGVTDLDIPRAHYYVWSETAGAPYLVLMDSGDSQIEYYKALGSSVDKAMDNNDDEILYLVPDSNPPADVETSRSFSQELQNFANWYTYYRRRELTATAAVGKVIHRMRGVQIGLTTIHDRMNQPVLEVEANGNDYTDDLLSTLYDSSGSGGTPLRDALEDAGQYYHCDDSNDGGIGSCPYASEADGGGCQQAFTVALTDGYYNGGDPGVGDTDGDYMTSFQDSAGHYLYADDDASETLADVALKYYEQDLSSSLPDSLPSNSENVPTHHDPAFWQHMVTYGVSFGVTGTLDPKSHTLDVNATNPDYPDWPQPNSGDSTTIDDLWHASVNGRGKFLSAANPEELITNMLAIMTNIESRLGSASSVSVNGDQLYEEVDDDIRLYQAKYSSNRWVGDVKSHRVDETTGAVNATAEWSAANQLDTNKTWSNRIFATYNGTSGVPFAWSSLNTVQKSYLSDNATMLDFLKGDDTYEGSAYRDRKSLLGDIVHSSPVFHDGLIYAGANDGALHVFNATSGQEEFAYVPGLVFPKLAELAKTDYTHHFYVDLTPEIRSGKHILDSDNGTETMLVGGLRRGGKGYYALDVTNASNVATQSDLASRVQWEYSNATDLGYTFSTPHLVRSNDPSHEWVIIFGNGYSSQNGQSELFILDTDGNLLKAFKTGVGSSSDKNGMATPVPIDVNNDKKVDYVYAGDLEGNLWKFDLTNSTSSNWEFAYQDTSGNPEPLFQARGPAGNPQPITAKPDVMRHCEKHGYMVVFGTGRYLGTADKQSNATQTIYGIWDYGDDADDQEYLGSFNRSSTPQLSNQPNTVSLLQQTQIDWRLSAHGDYLRTLSDNIPDWSTRSDPDGVGAGQPDPDAHAGWYFDLPKNKERVANEALIREGKAVVISHIPKDDPCAAGGNSIVHEISACDGGRLASAQFDVNNDGKIDHNDMIQVDIDGDGSMENVAPSGRQYQGKLQPPAVLGLSGDSGGSTEAKYFSSSTGTINVLIEKGVTMGVTYWKEM